MRQIKLLSTRQSYRIRIALFSGTQALVGEAVDEKVDAGVQVRDHDVKVPGYLYWYLHLYSRLMYWYWYLRKLHHLYVPVPGKFLQKNLPN